MAEEIPHFNLNFDFLYTQANDNDVRNENDQRGEKKKRFRDFNEGQRDQLLVDVEAKATKCSTNWVVKVFKVRRYTNRHIIDNQKLKENL